MRAIVLAAGRGVRMRPLTDTCPKPLLRVRGKALIEWHLEALARGGVREVVVNTAWLEDQFPAALGDGSRYGLTLHYSHEGRDHGGALETAGGIATALPWLAPHGDEAFWVVSGDLYIPGFDFDARQAAAFEGSDDEARLWLVPNPAFHSAGDFDLDARGRVRRDTSGSPDASRPWTYANVALARPSLIAGVRPGTRAALGPCLFAAAARGRLGGVALTGEWHNVGTPQELAALGGDAAPVI